MIHWQLILVTLLIYTVTSKTNTLRSVGNYESEILQSSFESYGVMLDAGSTGTRVYVYKWPSRTIRTMTFIDITHDIPAKKIKPGLAVQKIKKIDEYLQPLIDYAKDNVPKSQRDITPIFMGGTAGLRALPQADQNDIMNKVRRVFQDSGFLFIDSRWARVLTGQEEGAYLWLSLNYLLSKLTPSTSANDQVLTIDLGSSSTQIAFGSLQPYDHTDFDVTLTIPNYTKNKIYTQSYLGYGNEQARNHIIGFGQKQGSKQIISPCFSEGYQFDWDLNTNIRVIGTGSYVECQRLVRQYLNNEDSACQFAGNQCGINHTFQPSIDSQLKIYAISGVADMADFYRLQDFTVILHFIILKQLYQFQSRSISFCKLTWDEVSSNKDWYNDEYLGTHFFQSVYVYELLTYGYRIPQQSIIHAPQKIIDQKATWAIGGFFYQYSQYDCTYESPICSQQQIVINE